MQGLPGSPVDESVFPMLGAWVRSWSKRNQISQAAASRLANAANKKVALRVLASVTPNYKILFFHLFDCAIQS